LVGWLSLLKKEAIQGTDYVNDQLSLQLTGNIQRETAKISRPELCSASKNIFSGCVNYLEAGGHNFKTAIKEGMFNCWETTDLKFSVQAGFVCNASITCAVFRDMMNTLLVYNDQTLAKCILNLTHSLTHGWDYYHLNTHFYPFKCHLCSLSSEIVKIQQDNDFEPISAKCNFNHT
jgi:hypothetical protein